MIDKRAPDTRRSSGMSSHSGWKGNYSLGQNVMLEARLTTDSSTYSKAYKTANCTEDWEGVIVARRTSNTREVSRPVRHQRTKGDRYKSRGLEGTQVWKQAQSTHPPTSRAGGYFAKLGEKHRRLTGRLSYIRVSSIHPQPELMTFLLRETVASRIHDNRSRLSPFRASLPSRPPPCSSPG